MSKELEVLHTLCKYIEVEFNSDEYYICKEAKKFIGNALQRLEAIDNANPSEVLKEIDFMILDCITTPLQYEALKTVKQALLKAQEDEKLKVDICEMFGLDNLFPYNDTKAILKELEEYMGRKNQLWVDFMKTSKESKEQEKVLEIIKRVYTDLCFILSFDTFEEYNRSCDLISVKANLKRVNKEEFDTLKRYFK